MDSTARKIEIEIVGDAKNFQNALGKAAGSADSFGSSIARMGKLAAIAIGAAGIGGIAIVLKQGIAEFAEAAKVGAQTNAVLASTGGIANVTAGEVSKLASALMAKSGVDDEAIQSGENMLLTFTKVRNEVGAGNDIFNQATKTVLDFSVATGKDMVNSSILVGKALNDPIKGLTSLTRVGVTFDEGQKKMIKGMVESGNVMGAQKLILKELNTEFGGSAEALGKTLPGQLNILKETFNNLAGTMVGAMVPAFTKVVEGASKFLTKFGEAEGASAKFGVAMDALKGIASSAAEGLVSVFNKIDWSKTWDTLVASADTVATRLRDALDAKLGAVDWGNVGKKITEGITNAIKGTGEVAKKVAEVMAGAIREIDWNAVGRTMGPGLATAVLTAFATLMDVGFWVKNWDLALAVAAATAPGRVVALGAKLLAPFTKLGGDLVLAIVGGIEAFAPRVAAGLLKVLTSLPGIVSSLIGKLAGLVSAGFSRLGRLATFTIKVLGIQAAINAIAQFVTAVIQKLADLVTGAILGGYEIGKGIVQGILNGLASLAGAVWAKAQEIAQGAVDKAKSVLRIGSPSLVFEGIGADTIRGFILGITTQQPALEGKMKEAVSKALDAAKATVEKFQAVLGEAFGKLGEYATRQFAAKTEAGLAKIAAKFDREIARITARADKAGPAGQELAAIAASEDERNRNRARSEAEAALNAANAMEEGVEKERAVAAAKEQIRVADLANHIAKLQAQAELEERFAQEQAAQQIAKLEAAKARELQNYEERRSQMEASLDKQLEALAARLSKHPEEYDKIQKQIQKLLASYGIPMQKAGENLGKAFAAGLRAAEKEVIAAARALAKAVENQLKVKSPTKEGPMSSLDTWWSGVGKTLASGLDYRPVVRAAQELARTLTLPPMAGVQMSAAGAAAAGGARPAASIAMAGVGGGGYSGGGGNTYNFSFPHYVGNRRELVDAVRSEVQRTIARNK